MTIVEHKDGTMVHYVCITDGVNLLNLGDRVIAGQPIAVFETKDDLNRLGIKLHYLSRDLTYIHILPNFYTDEGMIELEYNAKYRSCVDRDLLIRELTKKEKKKLK